MTEDRGLSPSDREFLSGEREYAHETTEDNVWQRVRERVFRSLQDGLFMWQHIPQNQRQQIFDVGPEEDLLYKDIDEYEWEDEVEAKRRERDLNEFETSLVGLFAFLYAGIDESPGLDFDSILADALASVAADRGEIPIPESYQPPKLETKEEYDVEELLQRYQSGDSLSDMEELHLRRAIEGPLEKLPVYTDRDVDLGDFYMSQEEFSDMVEEELPKED